MLGVEPEDAELCIKILFNRKNEEAYRNVFTIHYLMKKERQQDL